MTENRSDNENDNNATGPTMDMLAAKLDKLLGHFDSLTTVVDNQQKQIKSLLIRNDQNDPSLAIKTEQAQVPGTPAGKPATTTLTVVGNGRSLATVPRRKLDYLDVHPNEQPNKFRDWVQAVQSYQKHYGLSDEDAIAELEWYGRQLIRHRVGVIRKADPSSDFQAICQSLIDSASPQVWSGPGSGNCIAVSS